MPFLLQALLEDEFILPEELFRQVVQLATMPSQWPGGDESGYMGSDWGDYKYENWQSPMQPEAWDFPSEGEGEWGPPETTGSDWIGEQVQENADGLDWNPNIEERAESSGLEQ